MWEREVYINGEKITILIETNERTGGYLSEFSAEGKEYYADISFVPKYVWGELVDMEAEFALFPRQGEKVDYGNPLTIYPCEKVGKSILIKAIEEYFSRKHE